MNAEAISATVWYVLHLIGSAMPLAILCYMLAFIMGGKKIRKKTIGAYVIVALIMFVILLRT